jgi:hypothetical protein
MKRLGGILTMAGLACRVFWQFACAIARMTPQRLSPATGRLGGILTMAGLACPLVLLLIFAARELEKETTSRRYT